MHMVRPNIVEVSDGILMFSVYRSRALLVTGEVGMYPGKYKLGSDYKRPPSVRELERATTSYQRMTRHCNEHLQLRFIASNGLLEQGNGAGLACSIPGVAPTCVKVNAEIVLEHAPNVESCSNLCNVLS